MLGLDVCEIGVQEALETLCWMTMFICHRGLLDEDLVALEDGEDKIERLYNPPAVKSLQEIQELDKDDESLVKYKQTLLGSLPVSGEDRSLPNVQVSRMSLLVEGRPPVTLPLTGDLTDMQTITLKEGTAYRIQIYFKVNREIVAGLRYHHLMSRSKMTTDKVTYMVGSYGPKEAEHEYLSPLDQAPAGLMSRGLYAVKSGFIDDDKNQILTWGWNLDIKKDWE